MFIAPDAFIRGAAMAPRTALVTLLAFAAVLVGLAWVTAVEITLSARRSLGLTAKARDPSAAGRPLQTL